MYSNKTVYCLNSAAVGDLVASAPSLKFAIDKFHSSTEYLVGIYPDFKDIFPFVPENKFTEIKTEYPAGFSIMRLNASRPDNKSVCKLTPSRLKLTQFGSISLLGRVLSDVELRYVPLKKVDVSHYGIDFKNAVIIITTYRDKQRTILPEEIRKIAEYVKSRGLTPVYVGKTGAISIWKNHLAISDFEYPGFGIDLRDKTSLLELTTLMGMSKAVVGMDSGPIHLAFTTDVPVVCGFTTVGPHMRVPYRGLIPTIPVTPDIICNFCESDWHLNFWNFNTCPRKLELAECVTKMTSNKFIAALNRLNIFED